VLWRGKQQHSDRKTGPMWLKNRCYYTSAQNFTEGWSIFIILWLYGGGGHWLVRMEWRPAGWLVSASVNLPLHDKVQKFSSGTGSPGWSRKKGRKLVVGLTVWLSHKLVLNWSLKTLHILTVLLHYLVKYLTAFWLAVTDGLVVCDTLCINCTQSIQQIRQ